MEPISEMRNLIHKIKVNSKQELQKIIEDRKYEDVGELILNDLDVSSITDMSGLFDGNSAYKISIENWDVSNVTNMSYMFAYSHIDNLDLSKFNTNNIINVQGMFFGSDKLAVLDLSSFNLNKIAKTDSVLERCNRLQKLIINRDSREVIESCLREAELLDKVNIIVK